MDDFKRAIPGLALVAGILCSLGILVWTGTGDVLATLIVTVGPVAALFLIAWLDEVTEQACQKDAEWRERQYRKPR
jgi:hypothetical protein